MTDLRTWLNEQIAAVEAQLAAHPPICQLDRRGEASAEAKALEGRYAVLRRARRLVERGEDLAILGDEARKARRLAAAGGVAWRGYAAGVQAVIAEIDRLAGDAGR